MDAERAAGEAPDCEVTCVARLLPALVAELQRQPGLRLAAAPLRLLPDGVAQGLGAALQDATEAMDLLLMRKGAREIDAVRRSARIADAGYEVFRRAAAPGCANTSWSPRSKPSSAARAAPTTS